MHATCPFPLSLSLSSSSTTPPLLSPPPLPLPPPRPHTLLHLLPGHCSPTFFPGPSVQCWLLPLCLDLCLCLCLSLSGAYSLPLSLSLSGVFSLQAGSVSVCLGAKPTPLKPIHCPHIASSSSHAVIARVRTVLPLPGLIPEPPVLAPEVAQTVERGVGTLDVRVPRSLDEILQALVQEDCAELCLAHHHVAHRHHRLPVELRGPWMPPYRLDDQRCGPELHHPVAVVGHAQSERRHGRQPAAHDDDLVAVHLHGTHDEVQRVALPQLLLHVVVLGH
eukprot:2255374-Rhodomonas_salina.1